MTIRLTTPGTNELRVAVDALREWQHPDAPMQLHPGDLGWFRRFGEAAAASAVRTWSRDGRVLAVGLLDGPDLLRLTTAPDARRDGELAHRIAHDVGEPARGVLPGGEVFIEAPADALLHDVLGEHGWQDDEPWTPLRLDLADPVPDPGVRVEVVGPAGAGTRAAVQRAAFDGSTFTDGHWHAMAAGPTYADARCLLARDDRGEAVAVATVWSAGPGKPGLLEPMGVHREHRGHGHGRAITAAAAGVLRAMGASSAVVCTPSRNTAAAGVLRAMGASSAVVCTPSRNTAAVATYRSAGFRPLPEVRDRRRDA
ncbi:GNAT family N-acetyltransferase [Saccharothrix obliqua]|uniref:GNAT family N-acetyltransferase n=1 Tax=Saccharothrix obliqua TaxID=2861747 RepID=UPI0027E378D6|nr:GNAT family N-acetyltransferase [Saccharothrix obliqua]